MKNKDAKQLKDNSGVSVVYCRVSSREQEETGFSLPSQERLLSSYSDNKGLAVGKIFSIAESASGSKQRKVFTEMMEYMEEEGIKILIVEKVDRLTRNLREALVVNDWLDEDEERKIHFVKQNLILHKNSKSDEKFRWDIEIVLAPDSATFPLWKRLSELYMTGEYTMKKLVKNAYDMGLRSRYGKKIYKSQIESFLKDPFYHGVLIHNGVVLNENGKHERMRTQEEFDLIQACLESWKFLKLLQMRKHKQ